MTDTGTTGASKRNWLKIIGITLLSLLIIGISLRVLIGAAPGRYLTRNIVEALDIGGQSIKLDGLSGDILKKAHVERFAVSDADGEWLVVEDINLSWRPGALLGGGLDLDELTADKLTWTRQPELTPSPNQRATTNPLKRYKITKLAIEEIIAPVTPQLADARFTLNANGGMDDIGGEATLLLLALDDSTAGQDDVNINLSWTRSSLVVGEASLQAPQNGLLQSLLPGYAQDDMRLVFTAKGDASNWRSDAQLLDGDMTVMTLNGVSKASQAELDLVVDLSSAPALENIHKRLGGPLTANITADITDFNKSPARLDMDSPNLAVTSEAEIDLGRAKLLEVLTFSGKIKKLSGLSQIAPLQAQDVRFVGQLNVLENNPKLSGEINFSELRFEERSAQTVYGRYDVALGDAVTDVTFDLRGQQIETGDERLNAILGDLTTASLSARHYPDSSRITLNDANISAEHLEGSAKGEVSSDDIALEGALSLTSLNSMSPELLGSVIANWSAQRTNADTPLRLQMSVEASDLTAQDDMLANLLGEAGRFDIGAELAPDQTLDVTVDAESGGLDFKAGGRLTPKDFEARANLNISRINADIAQLDQIALSARADGPLEDIAITVQAQTHGGTVQNVTIEQAALNLHGAWQDGAFLGEAKANARADGSPLTLSAKLSSTNGFALQDVTGAWSGLQLRGDLNVTQDQAPEGDFTLSGALPMQNLNGAMSAAAQFSGSSIELQAELDKFARQNLTLSQARVQATGTPDDLDFSLNVVGEISREYRDIPLRLQITGDMHAKGDHRLASAQVTGHYDAAAFRSPTPVTLKIAPNRRDLDASLELLGGRFDMVASQAGDVVKLNASADNLQLKAVSQLFERDDIKGSATFFANWTGDGALGRGEALLKLNDVQRDLDASPVVDLAFKLNLSHHQAQTVMTARGQDGLKLDAMARAPITVLGGLPRFDVDAAPVDLTVNGAGQLGALWAIAGVETVELDGDFTFTAAGNAPLASLRPVGRLTFSDGHFEHARIGARVEDINVSANFDQQAIDLLSATARGADGGSIEGRGRLFYDMDKQSTLILSLDRFMAIRQRGHQVQLSGEAMVERAEQGAVVTGDLNIDQARLDLLSLMGPRIQTVDVSFPDDLSGPIEDPDALKPRRFPIELDVNLKSSRQVFVTGGGLDVEMSSDFNVKGRLSRLSVTGQAQVVRGGFELAGQRFDFDQGRIDMNGRPANGLLNFEASRNTGDVNAILRLQGTVGDPEIILSSNPALPQDEVLARLLFGRSAGELSGLEAAQLATAVASLSGGGGLNPLSGLRDAIGLDRLVISQDDTGGASVATGKYIAEDVYLELRSRPNATADIAVEWTPYDNVQLGTEFGAENNARVTLQWKRDFE